MNTNIPTPSDASPDQPRQRGENFNEIQRLQEFWESVKRTNSLFDADGSKLCEVDYVLQRPPRILQIRTVPYENKSQVADNSSEIVYCTDDMGEITDERLTRSVAQKEAKQYLVSTSLIFHRAELLVQKRSADKRLDPDKYSASAHGVAKELHGHSGARAKDVELAALVNVALEINEELRHGYNEKPFTIKIWDRSEVELVDFASHMKWDDPDVLYLIQSKAFINGGYPLGTPSDKRTRFIYNGFIFSQEKPRIIVDPHEAQGYEWVKMSRITERPDVAGDAQTSIDESVDLAFERVMEYDPSRVARSLLRRMFYGE